MKIQECETIKRDRRPVGRRWKFDSGVGRSGLDVVEGLGRGSAVGDRALIGAQAEQGLVGHLAHDAAGPLVGGLLVQAWGYAPTFQLLATLAAISGVAFAALSRR